MTSETTQQGRTFDLWESVTENDSDGMSFTFRLVVPGGYLYRTVMYCKGVSTSLVFVPVVTCGTLEP